MLRAPRGRSRRPFSDHPSDKNHIGRTDGWLPKAERAYAHRAYAHRAD